MLIVLRYHLRVSTHGKDILGIVEVNNNSVSLFLATNFLVATKISQSVKLLNIVKSQRGYLQHTSIHFVSLLTLISLVAVGNGPLVCFVL